MAILCHCEQVSDRKIRKAIECGADDPAAVSDSCGAGIGCGGCLPAIEAMLATVRPAALADVAA